MPLTALEIKQLNPGPKPRKVSDEKGLYLLLNPNGSRCWRFKYRVDGKEKLLALGVYPEVSLADARMERDKARKLLRQGVDPMGERKRQKAARRQQSANSFEAIAREWHEKQQGLWTPSHAARVLHYLERDVFPFIGANPIAEVTPGELLSVLRKIESRDAIDVAGRTRSFCERIFRYAIQTGRAGGNPATELKGALKTRKVVHRAAMSRDQLPGFLRKLEEFPNLLETTRLALRLLVLTFVRPGELRGARWEEFNLERREWRIPAERMKMRAEHIVPLSDQIIDVLERLRPLTGHYGLIFPGRNHPKQPMSENTLNCALGNMGYKGDATSHGFRATASTILNESGFKPDVIERQLAHIERNKVRAAYHRAEYLEDRRRMMEWWGEYLGGLEKGANIVPIQSKSKWM